MPGRKNPMCNTFPRIGDHDDDGNDVDDNDDKYYDVNDNNDDTVNGDAISQKRFWL